MRLIPFPWRFNFIQPLLQGLVIDSKNIAGPAFVSAVLFEHPQGVLPPEGFLREFLPQGPVEALSKDFTDSAILEQ